jgi:GH25 family lysozyme M1 (1,4-beta-N-acetylmuramidase)
MKVIDLSDWQGDNNNNPIIDLANPPEPLGGAILKVSEGTNLQAMFPAYIAMANKCGLPLGAYCFTKAQTTEEAVAEAQAFLQGIQQYDTGGLPLGAFIDVEEPGVLAMDKDDITACASAFINTLANYNVSCGIYASSGILLPAYSSRVGWIDISQLADYVPYWVADYSGDFTWNTDNPTKKCVGHQYTENYNYNGNNVDMSEFFSA